METEILGCRKIYDGKDFIVDVDRELLYNFKRYVNLVCKEPRLPVWLDLKENKCFGADQDFYKHPGDFSFFSQPEEFLTNKIWGGEYVAKNFSDHIGDGKSRKTPEYIIDDNEQLEKFANKNILIVGAGPSASEVKWDPDDYDYIWSCTHFFRNPGLFNINFGLVTLGGDVDPRDPLLNEFLQKTDSILGIECGVTPPPKPNDIEYLKKLYGDRVFYFHTRYFSKLGAAARLLVLATCLGAKKVSFVGIDGYPVGVKHSFEGDKKEHDEVWRRDHEAMYNLYRRQFTLLWEYLLKCAHTWGMPWEEPIEYENLGEGIESNMTSEISKKYFGKELSLRKLL